MRPATATARQPRGGANSREVPRWGCVKAALSWGAALPEVCPQEVEVSTADHTVAGEVCPCVEEWLPGRPAERASEYGEVRRTDDVIVVAVPGLLKAHFYVGDWGACQGDGAADGQEPWVVLGGVGTRLGAFYPPG